MKKRILSIALGVMLVILNFNFIVLANNEILISPYEEYMNETGTVTSNLTYCGWYSPPNLCSSKTGGYNQESQYLYVTNTTAWIKVDFPNISSGTYDMYIYTPGAPLEAKNFTKSYRMEITGPENYNSPNMDQSKQKLGDFYLLKEKIHLDKTSSIKFYDQSTDGNMRIDVIKLIPSKAEQEEVISISDIKLDGQMILAGDIAGYGVGGTVNVDYKYNHLNEISEDKTKTKYQWYSSLQKDEGYEPIVGAINKEFTVTEDLAGRYLKVGIKAYSVNNESTSETFSTPYEVKYKLAFVDEFDYEATSGLDENFINKGWKSDCGIRVLGNPVTYQARVPDNVEVSNGTLKLITRKEHLDKYNYLEEGKYPPHTWTTGNVFTANSFGPYGIYDCSYKLAKATGLNQSFWAMNNLKKTDTFIEMDFNEGHYPFEVKTNLHRFEGDSRKTDSRGVYPYGNSETSTTLGDDFFRITGMLKPNDDNYAWNASENSDTYKIYFNNRKIRESISLQYKPDPALIYCSIAVYPGTFAGPLVDEDADGAVTEFDYVRYYEFLGANDAELQRKILEADDLINNAVIGTEKGNYTEEAVNKLKNSKELAESIVNKENITQTELNEAVISISSAIEEFKNSVIGGYIINVNSISFENETEDITIESTKKLSVVFTPANATNKNITSFESSDSNIAQVDSEGNVTGIAFGKATITATSEDGSKVAECIVNVVPLADGLVYYDVTGGKLIFDKNKGSVIGYVKQPTDVIIPTEIEGVAVKQISTSAFANCESLQTLMFEDGIELIGDWAFTNCTNLKEVNFADTIISINTAAFSNCKSLEPIVLPSSITKLEETAFDGCINMNQAYFKGDAPVDIQRDVFSGIDNFEIFYYNGATGFTSPTWNGYKATCLENTFTVEKTENGDNYNVSVDFQTAFYDKSLLVISTFSKDNDKLLSVKVIKPENVNSIELPKHDEESYMRIWLLSSFEDLKPLSDVQTV